MGSPKPLLDWMGRPLVQYQVQQLQGGGCDLVIVVLGHRASRVIPFVPAQGTRVIVNPLYRQGRATSVRAGAAAAPPEATWILVLGVDQPRPALAIRRVVRAAGSSHAAIVVPTYGGRHGHPTAFAGWLLPELAQVEDATLGLRAVVQRHREEIQEAPAASDVVLQDLNTPQDYQAARLGSANSPLPPGRG